MKAQHVSGENRRCQRWRESGEDLQRDGAVVDAGRTLGEGERRDGEGDADDLPAPPSPPAPLGRRGCWGRAVALRGEGDRHRLQRQGQHQSVVPDHRGHHHAAGEGDGEELLAVGHPCARHRGDPGEQKQGQDRGAFG